MHRRSIAVSTLIVLTASLLSAQVVNQGSNHLFLGIGVPNVSKIVLSDVVEGSSTGIGPLILTYQSGIRNRLALGAQLSYSNGTSGEVRWNNANGQVNAYRWTLSLFSLLAKADYHYSKSDRSTFYSGIGMGYGIASVGTTGSKDPQATTLSAGGFDWSLNLIGFRHMFSNSLGAYAELGIGATGVVNIGLSKKL